jgi:hypothetical protein
MRKVEMTKKISLKKFDSLHTQREKWNPNALPRNSPFSLLKKPFGSKLEEEGNLSGFSPPPPFFCCNGHLPLRSFSLFERSPFSLDLSLDLVIDLSLTLNTQQELWSAPLCLFLALERLFHHHNGRICVGLKTGFFLV